MTDAEIRELVLQHGCSAKLVRAVCRRFGWRYDACGAPAEWYLLWRSGFGDIVEQIVRSL